MELPGQPMQIKNRIYGFDFSRAQDGRKKIWIANSGKNIYKNLNEH